MAEPLLRVEKTGPPFWRHHRDRSCLARCRARRTARPHRSERRRQDHPDQPSRRRAAAACGSIRLAGTDITRVPAHRRSALGLARSFQITSLLPDFTAADNVALAAQAHDGHSLPFLGQRREGQPSPRSGAGGARPGRALDRADVLVSQLSHGEQRELELAVALATSLNCCCWTNRWPDLARRVGAHGEAVAELRRGSIVLVEHDMNAVFALADRISVLVYGRVIASGAPSEIRGNEEVKRAYLGEQHAVTAPWLTQRLCLKSKASRPAMGEPGAVRRVAAGQRGRDGGHDGPQWHGQDHHDPLHHGADAGALGRYLVRRPRGAQACLVPDRPACIGLVPEGRQIFPNLSVRENLVAASANRLGSPDPWTLEKIHALFPRLAERAGTWATRSRAASSRCWRSAAR